MDQDTHDWFDRIWKKLDVIDQRMIDTEVTVGSILPRTEALEKDTDTLFNKVDGIEKNSTKVLTRVYFYSGVVAALVSVGAIALKVFGG